MFIKIPTCLNLTNPDTPELFMETILASASIGRAPSFA